ncbi:DNA-binding transcriptional regulator, LacI/PurR family [Paramicrobacterium humi]|uniref:DNA-binding transcriptional regulator, LacI/PurR family n=1 Tax=Paramicrobacterium humi TaxID=640635 RepID=A0A1H4JY43_9MICO|nr:LacI family DNA-binding transcriptional regulator [Microbacterium humi]SEB51077.1 DNA-binding transcriptional regulator, LacI/PurR family [Microbacterium humi]
MPRNPLPDGRPTLADVASRAGVSPSTASIAFSGQGPVSDATKQKVLQAASDLGYAGPDPRAAGLRKGRSGIVGAVLASRIGVSFRDPVLIQTLDGLAEELSGIGAGLLLMSEQDEGSSQVTIVDAPVDAVVLMGWHGDLAQTIDVLRRRCVPVVAIESDDVGDNPVISVDNRGGSRLLAQHLRDLGHERVAVVTLGITRPTRPVPLTPELEALSVAPAKARLAGAREVYPNLTGWVAGASRVDAGKHAARALLDVPADERPTAIIAQSDLIAAGVIAAAESLGLEVPRDVSVVGFDGIRVDNLAPRLTTVAQPAQAKGTAAGRAVIAMLEGERAESTSFEVRFIAGETTAPPRA